MKYEILNDDGEVINTILASLDFVEQNYPGHYREILEPIDTTELQVGIKFSTQDRLDSFAKTRGYDGILSACTYATSTVAKFKSEGQYCVEARDATWAKLLEILSEVEASTRPMPSGYSDIEGELPDLVWPDQI